MEKTKLENVSNGAEKCPATKQFVPAINTFWSPLNDTIAPPDKKSRCTWTPSHPGPSPHTKKDWKYNEKIYPDVLAVIGNTPMVKLNKIPQSAGLKCNVYAKCEYFNPGGSVKDRIGYRMVEDAEKQGLLKPGSTIIEPSSGNTGIGLALAAAVKGYRCIIVMSEKMSNEKVAVLNALGAEIVRTPVTADSTSPDGMFGVTYKLKHEIPNSVILDQYSNPGNPVAHYDTTAEEIFDQCDKKVDMIVLGAGTGGTICGIGRKFKELSPSTTIVGVDPQGSILAQPETLNEGITSFYEVEGIGYDFIPTVLDRSIVDVWLKSNDQESLPMARRLIKEEGMLCGSSSGSAMVATLKAAKDLKEGQNVVVILPDGIRNYMTKFVSDQWMEARNLQPCVNKNPKNESWWNLPVTALDLPAVQSVQIDTVCENALQLMAKLGVDQIPVLAHQGFITGIVTLQNLMSSLVSGKITKQDTVDKVMVRIYPKLSKKSATLGLVSRILEKESYVVIEDIQRRGCLILEVPVGIVTSIDLVQLIN